MSIKSLDSNILALEKKYEKLDSRLQYVVGEIEDLESEQSDIEYEMGEIEIEIENNKKIMLGARIETLNIETDDVFTNDFMKASYFTAKYNETRPALQTVHIIDNELWALDGYRAIIITNNDIPVELRNSFIKWDVREKFENNTLHEEMNFIDIRTVMPKKEKAKYVIENVTSENFNETFMVEDIKNASIPGAATMKYEDFLYGINREFLNDALTVLKNQTFTVYFEGEVLPILFKSENIEILLLPIRI